MKVLIIQTAFIGDVILATAVIEKIKLHHPNSQIDFLLKKQNKTVLENHPLINDIICFEKRKNKIKSLWTIIKQVRRKSYDKVINIHRHLSSGLVAGFSGAPYIAGFDKNPISFLFTKRITHKFITNKSDNHEIKRNNLLIASFTDNYPVKPKLYINQIKIEKKVDISKPYICIAPTSAWFTKTVPLKKWVELINHLNDKYQIYLIGAPSDTGLCDDISKNLKLKRIKNLAGKLNILESGALLKKSIMNFVNDSAPLHLCSAIDAPVSALFCSTDPKFGYGPLSTISYTFQSAPLPCRPCGLHGKKECPHKHFKCSEIDIPQIVTLLKKNNNLL